MQLPPTFPHFLPPLCPNIPLSGVFFNTLSPSPFINQSVFTPNHVSVTAATCGGIRALIENGRSVFVGIWCVEKNLQLDGTTWGRCQRSPKRFAAVTDRWFSVYCVVYKCWLMDGGRKMSRGTSEPSASVLPLKSESQFHVRTQQRAKTVIPKVSIFTFADIQQ